MTDTLVWQTSAERAANNVLESGPNGFHANETLLAAAEPAPEAPPAVSRTGGDVATDATRTATAPAGNQPDANQILELIKVQKADMARLYDANGALIEGTITVEGQKLTTAQYRDMVVTRISLMYEAAMQAAKTARQPGNEGRIANGFQTVEQIEKELKDKYGIELNKGIGGRLTSYTVEQTRDATNNPQAKELLGKLLDVMRGVNAAAVNQNQPDRVTMEYADFLRTMGLTKQADTLLTEVGRNSATRYSRQFEELTKKINEDFATQRAKVVPPDQDPFYSLRAARDKIKAGDMAGAEAAFAQAYAQIDKLPKDKIEAEAKRLVEAQDALDKQIKEMQENGTLTPARSAQLEMQKQNLIMLQSVWEEFMLAKQFVEIDHAHYLLNHSPNKGTEANRRQAQEMLDDVRFTDKGKIAMIRHMQMQGDKDFSNDVKLATEGKPQQMEAFKQYHQSMAQATRLIQEAHQVMESDSDAAATKMQQARMHAENAFNFAKHIDKDAARFQGEQARKNVQRLIDTENAKTEGKNHGKIALLQHLLKPAGERDQATMALVDNLLLGDKADKGKLQQLKDMLKGDDLAMFDILQLHSAMVDAHGMEHAANSARYSMLQVDVESGNGENNPLAADIENNDPEGRFRAMVNWADVKEKTRDIAWYEHLWRGTKDIFIGLASSLVAAGTFAVLTGSTLGFGAPVGVAGGIAAGTGTYLGLKKLCGDDLTMGDVGMGVVNSIPGVAFVGAGRAIQASGMLLKLPGFARPAATLFLQGMASNASYHASSETLHYAQGLHPDMLSAIKKAGSNTLSDAPAVALFSVLGSGGARLAQGSAPTRIVGLNITNETAKNVIRTWGQMTVASEPALFNDRVQDAQLNKQLQMLRERQRQNQQNQPK